MSTERKPPMDNSPMGALKKLCRQKPPLRDELYRLSDGMKSAEWRAQVRERCGISLLSDSQVTRWRDWAESQMRSELRNDRMERFEEWLQKRDPGLTREQIREAGIDYFMQEAAVSGAQKDFVEIVGIDQTERHGKTKKQLEEERLQLEREKFEWVKKDDLERALDALHNEVKDNPPALEAFQRFKATITKARKP